MGFSDELWDGFTPVATKGREGKNFVTEVYNFMKKRREIELEYAKKLNALVKSVKVGDAGTLDSAWCVVKTETDSIANAHSTCAERLGTEVETTQKNWLTETAKTRKELKANGKKLVSQLQAAQSTVEKAKAKYEGSRKKQDAVQAEANADPNPKNQKKLQAEVKNAEKADDEYKKSVEKLKNMESRFYDSEMPQILAELQSMEEARVAMMKTSFNSFVTAQATVHPAIKSSCETMSSAAASINVDSDVRGFISNNKTGKTPPPRTEYEAYDSALGACKPGPGSSQSFSSFPTSSPASSGSFAAPMTRSAPPSSSTPTYSAPSNHSSPLAASAPMSGGGEATIMVKAQYAYTTSEPNELSFTEGALIKVTYQDDSGWWEGELNGRVGVFPSNHVTVISGGGGSLSTPPPMSPGASDSYDSTGGGGGGEQTFDQCKALYAYKAEDADELTISEGDILTIEDEDDEGWYYGRNAQGAYGKFPSNYVELLQY